jgi:inositol-pentakisphosphate 2-kinase
MQTHNVSKNESKTEAYVCPLRLVSGNREAIRPWVEAKVRAQLVFEKADHDVNDAVEAAIVDSVAQYFAAGNEGNRLLEHLRSLQTSRDPLGVRCRSVDSVAGEPVWLGAPNGLDVRQMDRNLCLAMTLRDCSLYVRVHYGGEGRMRVESKLGDLDLKSEKKIADWAEKEEMLVEKGWYKVSRMAREGEECELEKCA